MSMRYCALTGAILAVLSSTALADQCDGSESPTGWSIWCREAPLDPTATGGFVPSGGSPVRGTDIYDIFEPDIEGTDTLYYRAAYECGGPCLPFLFNETRSLNGIAQAMAAGIGTTELALNDGNEGSGLFEPDANDRISGRHLDMDGSEIDTFDFRNVPEASIAFVNKDPDPVDLPLGVFLGLSGSPTKATLEFIWGFEPLMIPLVPENIQDYWSGGHRVITGSTGSDDVLTANNANGTTQTIHRFKGGPLTPLGDIQQLEKNEIVAGYRGISSFHLQPVTMEVNFSKQRFNGTWGKPEIGGGDPINLGVRPVEFTASGPLNGQHMAAGTNTPGSMIESPGRTVTRGAVKASFYGERAAAVGGAYEITTAPDVRPAAAVREIAIEQTFNDVFVAGKVVERGPKLD